MGGDALTILTEARALGFEVRTEPGRLIVRGPRSQESVAQRLLERKIEVSALLAAEDADVAWRVAAMRRQVPKRGPIPVLVARAGAKQQGRCVSCGQQLPPDVKCRCSLCARAAWVVLHEIREGLEPEQ